MDNAVCLKCGGTMEEGYIAHQTDAGYKVLTWQHGTPEPIHILGMTLSSIKVPADGMPVSVSRCAACGFLELYAR